VKGDEKNEGKKVHRLFHFTTTPLHILFDLFFISNFQIFLPRICSDEGVLGYPWCALSSDTHTKSVQNVLDSTRSRLQIDRAVSVNDVAAFSLLGEVQRELSLK
jgi:hypothetical protein